MGIVAWKFVEGDKVKRPEDLPFDPITQFIETKQVITFIDINCT
jgi:hypothetical protein